MYKCIKHNVQTAHQNTWHHTKTDVNDETQYTFQNRFKHDKTNHISTGTLFFKHPHITGSLNMTNDKCTNYYT